MARIPSRDDLIPVVTYHDSTTSDWEHMKILTNRTAHKHRHFQGRFRCNVQVIQSARSRGGLVSSKKAAQEYLHSKAD